MRVISQDGRIDLPYEQIAVAIDCDEMAIIAYAVSSYDDTVWKLAKYSTEEKAEKVMEMLRTEYGKFSNGCYSAFVYPKLFRFPRDNDVE